MSTPRACVLSAGRCLARPMTPCVLWAPEPAAVRALTFPAWFPPLPQMRTVEAAGSVLLLKAAWLGDVCTPSAAGPGFAPQRGTASGRDCVTGQAQALHAASRGCCPSGWPPRLCAAGSCASILCAPGHCHSALCLQALGPDTEAPQVSPATRSQLTRARTGLGSAHAPWSALSSGTPWVWRARGKGAAGSRPGV